MKLFSLLLWILCWNPCSVWSQVAPPNNWRAQLLETSDDSSRAALLLQWYATVPSNQADTLIALTERGSALGKQNLARPWGRQLYQKSIATKGHLYRRAGKFSLAQAAFREIIATGNHLQDSLLISDAYSDLAYVFGEQERDDSATYYDLQALAMRQAIGSPKIGLSYNNLGFDYKIQGDLQKGLYYYFKAVEHKKQAGLENSLGNTYMNIGNIYQTLEVWDSSLYYYELTLDNAQALDDSLFIGEVLHSMGKTYAGAQQPNKADAYLGQAMQLFEQLGRLQHPRVVHSYHEWAKVKITLQELAEAEKLLTTAKTILESNGRSQSYVMRAHLKLQETLAWQQKKYDQMWLYVQQREALTDSLHQRTLDQKKYALLAQYEDELKVARIQTLEQQQQIDQLNYEKLYQQRFLLGAALLLLVLIIAFLYRLNQWRSKLNEELSVLNATKDKLFSIIAHDLKNPLSAFRSITQSLSDSIFDISREELDYFIKRLNTSAHSLFELLQNLLYWSIAQSGRLDFQPQNLSLQLETQEVLTLLQESAQLQQIQLENNIPSSSQAWGDSVMTRTILRNLLANAIKFTPNKGRISVHAIRDNDFTKILVKDTGRGIAPELVAPLFSIKAEHQRTEGSGTGLGLLLCKELVERQGGRIWLEESSPKGSTFCFTLPLTSSTASPSNA